MTLCHEKYEYRYFLDNFGLSPQQYVQGIFVKNDQNPNDVFQKSTSKYYYILNKEGTYKQELLSC